MIPKGHMHLEDKEQRISTAGGKYTEFISSGAWIVHFVCVYLYM